MGNIQPSALSLSGVVKSFGKNNEKRALSGIDLAFADGEITSITGPSGAGKSTLLQIAGLMLTPDQGEVMVRERRVSEMTGATRGRYLRQELGFVFQRPALIPEFTVLENVLLTDRILNGKVEASNLPYAKKLILEAGLSGCEAEFPWALSETQQKTVTLVRALVNMPSILLIDEPVAGMDERSAEVMIRLIWQIHEKFRTTCIMVNNERVLAERSDRVIELREGRVFADFRRGL
ncbi:ABC transporter ATP-binding protein [Acidaminobacter sp.]|uniref:ABC transporter ATP-binding protein n=1 Tax=Acidaminobacter sp. TaxID=1872102 RepID=UPI00137CB7FC|nr:ATP-binding cassette domain-containing protein [Acidaminobacter sp.]MDK9711646.1 ATP-binding cassette domain-containing protein [Acidaminobacter sp.]MZQ98265.1 ATP-binding cassette domain-containing protein [Acidaminobacter sp.]